MHRLVHGEGVGRAAGLLHLALSLVLWVSLAVSAAKVVHDFYGYVDRSIHVTVDDAEANISYVLATEGRYGFMVSPVLAGMDRSQTQFNYGPWYFYLVSGLMWLFGFSVTLARSVHLWFILLFVAGAACYFTGRHRAAAAAVFGLGLLYCFDASHWPMVRPDIMVSAFALGFVVSAGLAWTRGQRRYWFAAGLMATCGAFTHLIAASLVPSAVLVWAIAWWLDGERDQSGRRLWRRAWRTAVPLGAGIAAGLVMFYGAFDFDFGLQRRFFGVYREVTASPMSYGDVLRTHVGVAFGYLSTTAQWGVAMVLAWGWACVAAAMWLDAERRRLVQSRLLPPLVVWSAYLASMGFYSNFHQGYAILPQVMFLWTAGALTWVLLELASRRHVWLGWTLAVVAMASIAVQANAQIQWQFSGASWKIARTATWASFTEYSERVLQSIPQGASAWGSIVLGMEAPRRIQLVQWADAMSLFPMVAPEAREALTPDYIIFGYAEERDNLISALRGRETLLDLTARRLPAAQFRLASLVAAVPYGVTRTYARHVDAPGSAPVMPVVQMYDPNNQEWLGRVGAPLDVAFEATTAMPLRIGYEAEPPAAMPVMSKAAELPAGRYLFQVALTPGTGRSPRRLVAVTAAGMLRQTISEMGADGDFAAYLAPDTHVFLALTHPGGPVYVSQFDDGADPRIDDIEVRPVLGLLDPEEMPSLWVALPPLSSWTPTEGVAMAVESETVRVDGTNGVSDYQLMAPSIRVARNNRVTVRVPVRVEEGRLCAGVLNGDDSSWLVPPDAPREAMQFETDATQGFRVVLANCNGPLGLAQPSRFVVWPASYVADAIGEFYADRLVAAALYPERAKAAELAGPEVRTIPASLEVTRAEVEGPVQGLAPSDLGYSAALLRYESGQWRAEGRAEGAYSYLLQSTPMALSRGRRVIVSGRIETGGITLGLQRSNEWVAQTSVTEPGDFTVVMAVPGRGDYTVVVAHNLPQGLDTAVTITKLGLLPQ